VQCLEGSWVSVVGPNVSSTNEARPDQSHDDRST
jgi:hypothetical protein